ncbi:MAG: TlpA disulfide reductase family protein [Rhodothermales bacterium]
MFGPDTTDVLAPSFALPQLDSETLRLSDYRGRVVLLNFWATWCPPCRAEIPDLNQLQDELGPAGLEVIGISLDEEGFEAVRPFAEEYEVTYPLVVDDGTVAAQYGSMQGLPTTFVIDRRGRIVRRVIGLFPVEQMRPVLEDLLAQEPLE